MEQMDLLQAFEIIVDKAKNSSLGEKFYEDEILNYFIERQTNASAESLNSKIKCFRAQVKGIRDIPFFMYRLATVLG